MTCGTQMLSKTTLVYFLLDLLIFFVCAAAEFRTIDDPSITSTGTPSPAVPDVISQTSLPVNSDDLQVSAPGTSITSGETPSLALATPAVELSDPVFTQVFNYSLQFWSLKYIMYNI